MASCDSRTGKQGFIRRSAQAGPCASTFQGIWARKPRSNRSYGRRSLTREHRETGLVIDDEAAVRSIFVDVLNNGGYHVIEAADGPSDLKMLQSDRRIDLLITDVCLPGGMNGGQVADAGRVGRPKLKILLITGMRKHRHRQWIAGACYAHDHKALRYPDHRQHGS